MCKRIFASQTNSDGEVPFFKIGTIGGVPDSYISSSLFEDYKRRFNFPEVGEVLITCSGTVGRCLQYDGSPAYYQDSNIVWLHGAKSPIESGFLYWLLKRHDWKTLNTTTISRIYSSDLLNLKLSFPTAEEQEKITHFLILIDRRITIQNKIISKYEALIKGLCDILFMGTEKNVLPLKAIASIDKGQQINGLSLAKTGTYYYLNGGITPSGYVDDYNTSENTIAISEGGNSCGFVSYNTQKFWSGGHCYTVKLKSTQCRSKFLFFYLKYREKDIMQLRVGSGLPNIQKKSPGNFVVPLPTFEKQCYIERVLESITAKKEIETALLGQIQSQKKFLLSKMFI